MGHDDDRAPLVLELSELVHALVLEFHVAHGQDLVDEEDVRLDVDGYGEAQAHVHAGRVVLHRLIDETLDAGEVYDRVQLGVDLLLAHAQDRAVEVDVLAARQLGVEAGADLKHGGHASRRGDCSPVRGEDLRDALEQRRLARTVVSEQAEGLALRDLEGDVVKGPELLELRARTLQERTLEGLVAVLVDAEALGDALHRNRVRHQSSSTIRAEKRRKISEPRPKIPKAQAAQPSHTCQDGIAKPYSVER